MLKLVSLFGLILSLVATNAVQVQAKPQDSSIVAARSMMQPRSCHTATLLHDGTVLIAGGMVVERQFLDTAELYDPAAGTFALTGKMNEVRACHTATLLNDGRVLIAGGAMVEWLASAEVYEPKTKTFSKIAPMQRRRGGATATLLKDGRVLIAGGSNDDGTLAEAELFDPITNTFTLTGKLNVARAIHTATLLKDGRVLIAGGEVYRGEVYRSAEIYDPATGMFTVTGEMTTARHKHAAALLPDGDVLVIGGAGRADWRGRLASTEVYDMETGTFSAGVTMAERRFKFSEAVTALMDGRILVAGGSPNVEVYYPSMARSETVSGRLDAERFAQTATLLKDGCVLIAGGYDMNIKATSGAWLYTP